MSLDLLKSTTREIVKQLASQDFDAVVCRCVNTRLTNEDLRTLIREYGRKLVLPPEHAYNNLDVVQVKGASEPTWSLRFPLWTEEEGCSDLTLELTIVLGSGIPRIQIDDLHVL